MGSLNLEPGLGRPKHPASFEGWCTLWQGTILVAGPVIIGAIAPPMIRAMFETSLTNRPVKQAALDAFFKWRLDGMDFIFWWSLIPFLLLAATMARCATTRKRKDCLVLCCGGLLGALTMLALVQGSYWHTVYSGCRISSTAVLTFAVAPGWATCGGLTGFVVGHWITKRPWFRSNGAGNCQRCSYDLKGNVSGICPECGEPVSDTTAKEQSA